jgi:methylene-tetrahydromethanopterin dehydrogenase
MEKKRLLYLLSADPRVSPFDINMAYDAGFDAVIPYAGVDAGATTGLVQDIMFSRGPQGARASAIFVSGSDLGVAEAMLAAARKALFPPFVVGLMIDPRGGYTTAAALVAKVAALARTLGWDGLEGRRVVVAAGTGSVGKAAATLAAALGAIVILTSRRREMAAEAARTVATLYRATVEPWAAAAETDLAALAAGADVFLATGAAGVRLLSRAAIADLRGPKIVADINAVPPYGIETLQPQDDGVEIAAAVRGIGALAVGGLKFKVEAALLRDLLAAATPPVLDLAAARRRAEEILAGR